MEHSAAPSQTKVWDLVVRVGHWVLVLGFALAYLTSDGADRGAGGTVHVWAGYTIAAVLQKVKAGEPGDYRAQIEKISAFARGKGYCSLIEMAAAPVLSALRLFPADFAPSA